jgi:hypothetical protein
MPRLAALILSFALGCGRIGYEVLERDAGARDAGSLDAAIGDGGRDDAGEQDAGASCDPPPGVCAWTGVVSTSVTDAANWAECAGGHPQAGDRVFIGMGAPNTPVVDAPFEVRGFAGWPHCGGTIVLASTLVVGDPDASFTGSVRVEAASSGCTDCILRFPTYGTVRDGAKLTVGGDITILIGDHQRLEIGGLDTSGHFATSGGDGPFERWTRLSSLPSADPAHYGLRVRGTAAARSSISISGFTILTPHTRDAADAVPIDIGPNVELLRLDHVQIESYYDVGEVGLRIFECTGLAVRDAAWDDIRFVYFDPIGGEDYNVEVMCDPGVRIQMMATGLGAGSPFERDPTNVVDW